MEFLGENVMARNVCKCLGLFFLAVGLLGFLTPGLMGMHLSVAHNVIHLLTGAIAVFLGFRGTYCAAKNFCFAFGTVYGLLGLAGLLAPPGVPQMHGMAPDQHLLSIVPGHLEFGTADSVVHVLIAALFLYGGFSKYKVSELKPGDVAQTFKEKVGIQ